MEIANKVDNNEITLKRIVESTALFFTRLYLLCLSSNHRNKHFINYRFEIFNISTNFA